MQFTKVISLFLLFVIFHDLVTDLTSAGFVHKDIYIRIMWKYPCTLHRILLHVVTERKEHTSLCFCGIYCCDGRRKITRLRLNKGQAFYVSITALLLFPCDLFQASLLLCFH